MVLHVEGSKKMNVQVVHNQITNGVKPNSLIFPAFGKSVEFCANKAPSLKESTKTSIFYINDYHGKAANMAKAVNASNLFDSFEHQDKTDKLKLSAGDIMIGEDVSTNRVAMKFLKFLGITATAVGNHECDLPSDVFRNEVKNMPAKLLACNIKSPCNSDIAKYFEKSYIQEINGTKYGIIGTMPSDLNSRIKYAKAFKDQDIIPENINKTIESVQKEIDKLKTQGIDKVILLSHCGYSDDIQIAKNTSGIDVIIGGHSHDVLKSVKKDVNLFYSKSGEPVIITQAGRDGKFFGILNLEFDSNGIIKKAQNNIGKTANFSRNLVAKNSFEEISGKPNIIGTVRTPPTVPDNDLIDINPMAFYGADAIKEKANAEIALVGAGNLRGYLEKGPVDTESVDEISPFKNKIVKVKYTEKEIIDAIKICAKSFKNPGNKPGLMYASGLKYKVDKNGKLLNAYYINDKGQNIPIDVNNPRDDKTYTVAINDYSARGNDGLAMLNKYDNALEKYDWDITAAIAERIRKSHAPIDITDDKRLEIV